MNRTVVANGSGVMANLERHLWDEEGPRRAWQASVVNVLRLLWAVGRDLAAGQLTLRAMSLVYTTLLSLVPLLAISFSILKGFGVHNQIEPFLLNALEPLGERRDEVVGRIVDFVDNVQVGVLGSVGFLLLFYTVVSLMQKIEHAVNDVWQVNSKRTITERFKDYLSVIIIAPVLIFASLGIMAAVMSDPLMARVVSYQPVAAVVELMGRLVPVAMVSVAFTFIYMFVPHTRVRWQPALTGGIVAGILWNAVGWMFAAFVAQAGRYTAIYSGFATPILFMIWLYVGWLILLVGATIAFYRQHPEYLAGRHLTSELSAADRERLALHAVAVISEHFYGNRRPPDAELLSRLVMAPAGAVEDVLEPMHRRGLVALTDTDPPGYLPGCPWETATVGDVLETAHQSRRGRSDTRPARVSNPTVDQLLDQRRRVLRDTFDSVTLKSLGSHAALPLPGPSS